MTCLWGEANMQISHFIITNENYVAFELPSINSLIGVESLSAAEYTKFLKKYNEYNVQDKGYYFRRPGRQFWLSSTTPINNEFKYPTKVRRFQFKDPQ